MYKNFIGQETFLNKKATISLSISVSILERYLSFRLRVEIT